MAAARGTGVPREAGHRGGAASPVTGVICRVPERAFTRAPVDTILAYLCRFAVRFPLLLLRGFSWQRLSGLYGLAAWRPFPRLMARRVWLPGPPRTADPDVHHRTPPPPCVPPSS